MIVTESIELNGKTIEFEMGKVARQADGAVVVSCGDTKVLVSAVFDPKPKDASFVPLTVDYREWAFAGGKIPGGFFKREGRPSEKEILTSRMIDRSIRPLFPKGYRHETQVIGWVMSADGQNDPGILAKLGASMALYCSRIPFTTPFAAFRVGLNDDGYQINPTTEELEDSRLNMILAARKDAVMMVEAGAEQVSEDEVIGGLEFVQPFVDSFIELQERVREQLDRTKVEFVSPELDGDLVARVEELGGDKIREALKVGDKIARRDAMSDVKRSIKEAITEENEDWAGSAGDAIGELVKRATRHGALNEGVRFDGRAFDEVREITAEVSYAPRVHGSALFTRGETQAFVTSTLGTGDDARKEESYEGEEWKRFMLHYNFPPFSVGEARFMRGPGRREIGHGNLAERAILPVLPTEEEWPYVIRTVSDIFESNGSSSMASICGGILSMMDAGVPIKAPVAGVAMGLMKEGDKVAILSDIAGEEDHYGDMDFKVAGTPRGITALQMDIKVSGLSREIFEKALNQARENRLHILRKMSEALEAPRDSTSPWAPQIVTVQISVDRIRDIIGPGGRIIRAMQEETGCKINVEDDGTVQIASPDAEACAAAKRRIQDLTAEAEVGAIYRGKVRSIKDFGAFVEILPGTDGLLHISEVADHHVENMREHVEEGQEVTVKVVKIEAPNRVRLSLKALTDEERASVDG
ncbi:MAG: polyribonucleotide nucleotidyltransferase [Acidobacteria bacterium]|nr:polyribonucleotide nucleotidyltransferase [Acidobacteriota bacterium]